MFSKVVLSYYLSFAYSDDGPDVLRDVSFDVGEGEVGWGLADGEALLDRVSTGRAWSDAAGEEGGNQESHESCVSRKSAAPSLSGIPGSALRAARRRSRCGGRDRRRGCARGSTIRR